MASDEGLWLEWPTKQEALQPASWSVWDHSKGRKLVPVEATQLNENPPSVLIWQASEGCQQSTTRTDWTSTRTDQNQRRNWMGGWTDTAFKNVLKVSTPVSDQMDQVWQRQNVVSSLKLHRFTQSDLQVSQIKSEQARSTQKTGWMDSSIQEKNWIATVFGWWCFSLRTSLFWRGGLSHLWRFCVSFVFQMGCLWGQSFVSDWSICHHHLLDL